MATTAMRQAIKEAGVAHSGESQARAINELAEHVSRIQGYDHAEVAQKEREETALIVRRWDEMMQYHQGEDQEAYWKAGFEVLQSIAQKVGYDVPRYVNEPIEPGTINWHKVQRGLGIRGPMPPN